MDSYDSEYLIQFVPDEVNDICPECEYPLDDSGYCDFCDG